MTVGFARSMVLAAAAMAALSGVLASCAASTASIEPATTPRPAVATAAANATPPPAPVSLAPIAPEIVGVWETRSSLDASGSQQIVRTYRFAPDATYDYRLAVCRSSTDCTLQAQELGYVQAAGGLLSLLPQTDPSDGPRTYPYQVGRDPNVGDIQLHLALPDGTLDIFYFSP